MAKLSTKYIINATQVRVAMFFNSLKTIKQAKLFIK